MKLHLGCGSIYLKDYINIDSKANYFAVSAPKDILEKNSTTFDKYYKHKFGESSNINIVDMCSNILDLPFNNNSVDEIILMHVLEHFPSYQVSTALSKISKLLKNNGKFIISVPDIKETAKLLAFADNEKDEDFYIRLIHGTQKNEYSHHYCGYTRRTLENLLRKYNFKYFETLPNINFYPAIHLKAHKERS